MVMSKYNKSIIKSYDAEELLELFGTATTNYPPVISNLEITPASWINGTINPVVVSFDYLDSDGDIETWHWEHISGQTQTKTEANYSAATYGITGTSGSASTNWLGGGGTYETGSTPVTIWLIDAEGNESNHLSHDFTILSLT